VGVAALSAAAGVLAAPAAAGADLAARLGSAVSSPAARSAAVAVDLETGEIVYARNASLSLAPASTEKLVLSYALLARLGPGFRIPTDVYGEGRRAGARWVGDLVLVGRGDPTLSSADLRTLARAVRAAGIRHVTGSVAGDETYFDARRTAPGWRAAYYLEESAPLSALAVDSGLYAGRSSRAPALAAAARFHEELRRAGVRVARPPTARAAGPTAWPLATVRSEPLARIVRAMNLDSDNFVAELLLKQLGAAERGAGTTAAGAAEVREALAEASVPLAGVRFVDGSGLSLLDRVTAGALVTVLRLAWEDARIRAAFFRSLPVAGLTGTLRQRMRRTPAAGLVRAKTGTTRRACALAGYVAERYAFAVIQNGRPVPRAASRDAQDRFAVALARL
jgi:D-alanyl-D-alanine carboxypeptidase/D-alanyl-D-alanine-endopeptidase (penicillin-binding protein 4)